MTTPIPTDEQIAEELTSALLTEAARVTPEPALHKILARAHEAGPTKKIRRRGGWVPVLTGAVAAGGLVAAAIVIFAPGGDDPSTPRNEAATTSGDWPTPCDGCPVDLAVWYHTPSSDELISGSVTVTSSGDVGMDAVEALLTSQPSPMGNPWGGLAGQLVAEVNSVTPSDPLNDTPVVVDFDRQLSASASMEGGNTPFSNLTIQQLVLTVQSALRTDDPVLISVNGVPAEEAFEVPLSGPIQANWQLVSGIRVDRPDQRIVVHSPFELTGESRTYEGNVLWEVSQDGDVVDEGHTTGGGHDAFSPFTVRLHLEPGSYTVKLWEPNVAGGSEAWTDEMSVVYVDILVE